MKNQLMMGCLIFLLFGCLSTKINGQERQPAFYVPEDFVALLLVVDPKCPLVLGDPNFLKYEKSTHDFVYTVTNKSNISVKSIQIKELSWFGNTWYTSDSVTDDQNVFFPENILSTFTEDEKKQIEFTDFDRDKAIKLGLSDNPKEIWIIMVTKVELFDGTIYDATSKYESIEKFIETLQPFWRLSKPEIAVKETGLRDFVRITMLKSDKKSQHADTKP